MSALARAALSGAATGLRTSAGLGILVEAGEPGLPASLRGGPARAAAALAILAELVIDKLPQTPSRLERPGLTGRVAAAAAAGAVIARGAQRPLALPVAVAAGAALLSARIGHDVRASLSRSRPPLAVAAAEDVVALSLASNAA
jgi:uncharacterized membrane protein